MNRPLKKAGSVNSTQKLLFISLLFLTNAPDALAAVFVYSMFVDLEGDKESDLGDTYAQSRSLRSLSTIITSVETYFHPSNYGTWTVQVCPISKCRKSGPELVVR